MRERKIHFISTLTRLKNKSDATPYIKNLQKFTINKIQKQKKVEQKVINASMMKKMIRTQWLRLIQIFAAKLVLEVFGGAGAIWGFSEAVGLRVPQTVWFWRPCALVFGFIFFCRWLLQIQDYVVDAVVVADNSDLELKKSTEFAEMRVLRIQIYDGIKY